MNPTPALFAPLLAGLAILVSASSAHAVPVPGQGFWQTTLQARDLNGDTVTDAFYDTQLNITWLRDANASRNNGNFGLMTWFGAQSWATNLAFGGFTDWRLPTMLDTGAPGCDLNVGISGTDCGYNVRTAGLASGQFTVYSEMAHLFYMTLGNRANCVQGFSGCTSGSTAGAGLSNTGDFIDLSPYFYWTGLQSAPTPTEAWFFNFSVGIQTTAPLGNGFLAMAVRDGDALPPDNGGGTGNGTGNTNGVPEPGSLVLLGLALAALGVTRQKATRASARKLLSAAAFSAALSLGSPAAADQVIVVVKTFPAEGRENELHERSLKQIAYFRRAEPTANFHLFRSAKTPTSFLWFETYESQAAYESHVNGVLPNFRKEVGPPPPGLMTKPPEQEIYVELAK